MPSPSCRSISTTSGAALRASASASSPLPASPTTSTSGGAPVAGIGVAGAPSGDLDEKYAQAGAATLGH